MQNANGATAALPVVRDMTARQPSVSFTRVIVEPSGVLVCWVVLAWSVPISAPSRMMRTESPS
jgi:hypothetical protein